MSIRIEVQRLAGKQLRLSARGHTVITDRMPEDGGTDRGCSSGELLLMAIGSCATGALRTFLEERGIGSPQIGAEVCFEPVAGRRDRVVIALEVGAEAAECDEETLARAATSGGVTSRIALGSEIEVRIRRTKAGASAPTAGSIVSGNSRGK